MNTTNVITFTQTGFQAITSFQDNTCGNQQANDHFQGIIKKINPQATDKEMEFALDTGHYQAKGYKVLLTHSSTLKDQLSLINQ